MGRAETGADRTWYAVGRTGHELMETGQQEKEVCDPQTLLGGFAETMFHFSLLLSQNMSIVINSG